MKTQIGNMLIWIIASIVFTIITLYVINNYYNFVKKNARINMGINSFYLLRSTINDVCSSFTGERRFITIIYPKDFLYIAGKGEKICYNYDGIETCENISCKVNSFNISIYNPYEPYKEALSDSIAKFTVEVKKVKNNLVEVRYTIKI